MRAVALLERVMGVCDVARAVGVRSGSVSRWKAAYEQGGKEALKAKLHPGGKARMTKKQKKELLGLLTKGPRAHGYKTELWTLQRVADVIRKQYRIAYHPSQVWRILREQGWGCQKPERPALGHRSDTVGPRRRRLGLYFRIEDENICGEIAADFVLGIQRALRRRLLVVWDRWDVHRKATRLLDARLGECVTVEWLPPYSPDLNPVEGVWDHAKYADLANFIPEDIGHLRKELDWSLRDQRSTTSLLRSFFDHAELPLELLLYAKVNSMA